MQIVEGKHTQRMSFEKNIKASDSQIYAEDRYNTKTLT
jgi:hypothetical protein